jgi:Holliday junction resolvase RusA-like endonuclease
VRAAAQKAIGWGEPAGSNVAIRLTLEFYFRRPKTSKAMDKTTRPDLDKLCRSIGDSLTGVIFEDDSQVTEIHATKLFGEPRVEIRVEECLPPMRQLSMAGVKTAHAS